MKQIFDLIGGTPLVEFRNVIQTEGVRVFGKLEGQNPGGSVKDRAAYNMIKSALDRGDISKEDTLIEATSGNTGIALAMIASMFQISIELVMPENSTQERILSMEAFGAKVTLVSAKEGMEGARDYADKMVAEKGYKMLNQFANEDNWKAHYKTTGPEIWNDTQGTVTHFVSSMGTTGTVMGVSKYLKEQNNSIQIIGAQPTDGSRIPGIRRWPKEYLPKIFDPSRVDEVVDVSEADARIMTKRLAKEEGIFAGMSSGGAAHLAVELAKKIDKGIIVCIICDRGDRYLSSDLFQ